jgi:hypothetical protein
MKTHLLMAALCPGLGISASAQSGFRQECRIEAIAATNHSTQQCAVFTIAAGARVTIQSSTDLEHWTDETRYYSLGNEFAFPMREVAAPPPPDPNAPPEPPGPPFIANVSLRLQPSSGESAGTIAAWPSLDDGRAIVVHLAENMAAQWDTVPMFSQSYGGYQLMVWHPPGTSPAPTENPTLGEKDTALLALLTAHLADMNAAVVNAAATARNTPMPAGSAPGQRQFFRAFKTFPDTDGDGSTDSAEFEMLARHQAAANHPGDLAYPTNPTDALADPFDPDKDKNGVADGLQLDRDNDLIADSSDVAPNDSTVAAAIQDVPRYAVFPAPGGALQINDRGTVLYPHATWSGGQSRNISGMEAMAINDSNQIIGWIERKIPWSLGERQLQALAYQNGLSGTVHHVERTIDGTIRYGIVNPGTVGTPGPILSDTGVVRGDWDFLRQHPDDFLGNFEDWNGDSLADHTINSWMLPVGGDPDCVPFSRPQGVAASNGAFMWGSGEAENSGYGVVYGQNALPPLPSVPPNVIEDGANREGFSPCSKVMATPMSSVAEDGAEVLSTTAPSMPRRTEAPSERKARAAASTSARFVCPS